MKKTLSSLTCALCMLFLCIPVLGQGTSSYSVNGAGTFSVTVKVPDSMIETYGTPYVHLWGDYTTQWPGEELTFIGNSQYRYTFSDEVSDISCVVNFNGIVQTEDITDITSSICLELEEYNGYDDYIPYHTISCSEESQPEIVYADPFQQAVLHETASVDTVIFINDETYPWEFNGSYITSTNKSVNKSKSEFSFTYTSSYQTQVQFSWINYYTSYHSLQCYVDGAFLEENTSNSASSKQFFLPAGTHVVTFRDSVFSTGSYNRTSGIRNIRVLEVRPLETAVLADGSMPLTFQNETTYPWIILSDGSIRNGNYGYASSVSSFSTTFTITEPSLLSFDCIAKTDNSTSSTSTTYHKLTTYINEDVIWEENGVSSYANRSVLLSPGTYTVKWRDWTGSSTNQQTSSIRNISLTSEWTEVELEYAGTLGVEVLYKHDVLADVRCLKVKGNLNSTDWEYIKQMTGLRGLDLSEASFTNIPAKQFQNRSTLNYLVLPEGVQTIGEYAFAGTKLRQLHIPSTVTSIGNYAFNQCLIYNITFAAGSQLQSFGNDCFRQSNLKRIEMPNTVTSIGSECFYQCALLDTLIFSDAIATLPNSVCCECSKLSYVHFPQNLNSIGTYCFENAYKLNNIDLPESLCTIGNYAFESCTSLDTLRLPIKLSSMGYHVFESCTSLKYIELPSSASIGYDYTFYYCTAVNTVICPSATPPSISNDPFASASAKSTITLQVPSVSVVSYKLDPYWYKFGTIIEGEDPNYWDIRSELMLTNNRRMNGKPDIDIRRGASLMVGGAAPMPVRSLMLECSGSTSAALVNSCPFMTADSAYTDYYINDYGKWYFLSPIYDVDLLNAYHGNNSQYVFRRYNAANRASNGTGSSWQNVTDGVLHQGQGYILQSNGTGWMHMPALNHSDTLLFRTEDVEVPLQTYVSENVANESWNFIGNPYPAYYDIWYMDFTAPITVWTGSTYKAYSLADDNYALRPMEAFFVQKPETVDKIIFHKEGRQTTTSISHSNTSEAPARRNVLQNTNRKVYNLSLMASDGMADETRVVINDAASIEYELSCDASKFISMDANCPQLYTLDLDGNRLAINERPLADGMVSLGVQLPSTGEYTFAAVATQDITLIDNQLGISHDLHAAPYTFTSDMEGENITRFSLLFGSRPVMTGLDNIDSQAGESGSYIYTLDGRVAGYISGTTDIHTLSLPTGVYMVRAGKEYTKIVVR